MTVTDLIGLIYEAALEPGQWSAVVERVLWYVQAKSGLLFTPFDRIDTDGFYFPVNISQDFLQLYASRYQPQDLWAIAMRDSGVIAPGSVVPGDEVVPRAALLASPFYREFLRPQGTGRICVAWIFRGGEQQGVRSAALSVHRGVHSRPFSARSVARMRMLLPHLSRSLGVMFRLRDAELKLAATRSALDRLASGVILIGERRQVVFANRVARGLLAERDGLALVPGKGSDEQLAAEGKGAELAGALSSALDVAVTHFSAGIRVARSRGRPPLVLNVSALPEANNFGGGPDVARVIVFVTDTGESPQLNKQLLARVYALTEAELRVVAEICAGGTLKDVARRLQVSEPTVRTQLQSAFTKTGTGKQAELVKLALSLSSTLT